MSKITKRQQQIQDLVDRTRKYSPVEAVELLKTLPSIKFDETLELAFRLGINPKHADQQVRATVMLPAGTGKTVRVAVVCKGEHLKAAEEAGADVAGAEDLIARIGGGWMEFDVLLATQDIMAQVAKLGKLLGPRGLMPNPKTGTVVAPDAIAKAIRDFKGGKIEFRNDRQGNVHAPIGKRSFNKGDIVKNFAAVADAIQKNRPATAKGTYIKSVTLSSTMGPGLRVDPLRLGDLSKVGE